MSLPKNTANILLHLYPNSEPLEDWVVSENEGVTSITYWNDSLGSKPTKSELENASQESEKTAKLKILRQQRNQLLTETDWMGNSDVQMSTEWTTYRQNLRDITNGLTTVADIEAVTWPTKPE